MTVPCSQKRAGFAKAPCSGVVALLSLLAVLVSLLPCEITTIGGGDVEQVVAEAELPDSPETPTSSCADNCPCLCAGSCSGALVSHSTSCQIVHHPMRAAGATQSLFARIFPDSLFHPPRLHTVA